MRIASTVQQPMVYGAVLGLALTASSLAAKPLLGDAALSAKSQADSERRVERTNLIPEVRVAKQKGSPIRLDVSNVHVDESSITIEGQIVNVGSRPISAYTFYYEQRLSSNGGRPRCYSLRPVVDPKRVVQPMAADPLEITIEFNQAPIVVLGVDFVELVGGPTWGLDRHESKEILAGMRASMHAVRDYVRDLLVSKDRARVAAALDSDLSQLAAPEGASEKWRRGFNEGKRFMREWLRVRLGPEAGAPSTTTLEEELGRSYDSSGGK